MDIPRDAHVAVLDGRKFLLFRNSGDEALPVLDTVHHEAEEQQEGAGGAMNQAGERDFAKDTADKLNLLVVTNRIKQLVVVAAPKTLGELRRHYHKTLEAALVGEVAKEMTNRTTQEIADALKAA